jgi:hypothetical protein
LPPISLERILQVLFGEDRKSRSSDCFSVLATSSLHRFDHALHVIRCHFHIAFCLIKKNGEKLQETFFLFLVCQILLALIYCA